MGCWAPGGRPAWPPGVQSSSLSARGLRRLLGDTSQNELCSLMAGFWKRWRSGEGEVAPDPKVGKGRVAAECVRLAEMWKKGSLEKLLESAAQCSFIVCNAAR